ncbi:ribbon-helix-helix domain-containing protein [Bacillus thuringiensis]|uniref:ribbon-helix-helix domain-containing protein n=1 Tax=Bacillus thuringiensis TaxID=1428 RepID=UPI0021D6904E|nr:ribbon-helix-helix domain-containing protein [Bacillus thuringiensis]MCU7666837.1 ribbon-helix-helix domain-containing protein [Bacillus thuringiensis]
MERKNIPLRFPKDLLDEVEKYQKDEMITSRAAAIYELIRFGLKYQDERSSKVK